MDDGAKETSSSSSSRSRGKPSKSDGVVTVVKEGKADSSDPGKVTGVTLFSGPAPERKEISAVANTEGCDHESETVLRENVIVTDGKLQNVFVYVDKGLNDWEPTAVDTTPATMDQNGCVYEPHVLGVRAGRPVQALNSDPISHNVHVVAKRNETPNITQSAGSKPLELSFDREEVPVTLVCDIHNWMKAYVCVVEHPFFAVTDEAGRFEIDGLPPGKYSLRTWHESFKKQTADLTVGAGGEVSVEFTFKE